MCRKDKLTERLLKKPKDFSFDEVMNLYYHILDTN